MTQTQEEAEAGFLEGARFENFLEQLDGAMEGIREWAKLSYSAYKAFEDAGFDPETAKEMTLHTQSELRKLIAEALDSDVIKELLRPTMTQRVSREAQDISSLAVSILGRSKT